MDYLAAHVGLSVILRALEADVPKSAAGGPIAFLTPLDGPHSTSVLPLMKASAAAARARVPMVRDVGREYASTVAVFCLEVPPAADGYTADADMPRREPAATH